MGTADTTPRGACSNRENWWCAAELVVSPIWSMTFQSNLLHSQANQGIAHTRWATGPPTEVDAHPHTDDGGSRDAHGIALVHNGIIENHEALRQFLTQRGHVFQGQSDTSVGPSGGRAVRNDLENRRASTLHKVEGAFYMP